MPSCGIVLLPTAETTVCHRLGSAGFPRFHCYYAVIRLLAARWVLSICKTSIPLTAFAETVRPPRYACTPLRARHALLTPAESPRTRLTSDSCCLRLRGKYRLPLYDTYGAESLHAFALRLSRSNCLRLNPASRPRLQGCVPAARYGFTGFGLSPNCTTSAELAHPPVSTSIITLGAKKIKDKRENSGGKPFRAASCVYFVLFY